MAEKGGHWVKSAGGGMSFKPAGGGVSRLSDDELRKERDRISGELFVETGRRPAARTMMDRMPTTPRWDELTARGEQVRSEIRKRGLDKNDLWAWRERRKMARSA
jgi:hypothetical protein